MMGLHSMRLRNIVVVAAFLGISYAVAVTAYALRARDSAIRGWAEAIRLNKALSGQAAADNKKIAMMGQEITQDRSEIGRLNQGSTRTASAEAYRAIWRMLLGLPHNVSDLQYALAVRDFIHSKVPVGDDDVPGTPLARLANAVTGGGETAQCGDYSVFFRSALMASGIPARTVQLASQAYIDTGAPETHVTVEALIDGHWILIDPTYDATLSCGSDPKLLNVATAHQCVANGGALTIHQGKATRPGRGIRGNVDFSVPFEKLLAYYMRADTVVDGKLVKYQGFPNDDWLIKAENKFSK